MDRLALPRGNFFLAFLPLLPALVMLTGCVQFVEWKYSDISLPLGKHHYIHVSTFPAWFPSSKDEVHLPYLYSRTRSHDEVYFQLHVKNNRLKGPPADQGIGSCRLLGFSYRIDDGEWKDVITASGPVESSFWQQKEGPVPFTQRQAVSVRLEVELNDQLHQTEGTMRGVSHSSPPLPLMLRKYGV